MSRSVAILIAALAFASAVAGPSASAAGIRECGHFVPTGNPHGGTFPGYWTYRQTWGYTPVFNLTTRVVHCHFARYFAIHQSLRYRSHYFGFTCGSSWLGTEAYDIRCTKRSQVIHWQGGV